MRVTWPSLESIYPSLSSPEKLNMSSARNAWKAVAPLLLCTLGLVTYVYWETLGGMAEIWRRSETYTHGFVVPLISAWLIWQKRETLARMAPRPILWPALIVAAFSLAWLMGELTAINALTQFSSVAIIVFAATALLGPQIAKELAFPLGFLFFAVPIGEFLLPNLMEWTADFTVSALRLSNIPVYREGQNFVIPSGNWSVVEACSGIRYMIASVTVGTLYAYLTYASLKRRLIFVLVSFLVPLVANWLRAYMIVMLGHLSGNTVAVGVDHLIYGWVFFGVVIAIMFAIGSRWAEAPTESPADNTNEPMLPRDNRQRWWMILPLILAFIAGPVLENTLHRSITDSDVRLSFPTQISGWLVDQSAIDWKPRFVKPSSEYQATFSKGDERVGLYVAYYRNQGQGKKLVASTNVLVMSNDLDWQQVSTGRQDIEFQEGFQEVRTAELLHRKVAADDRYVAWRWYRINGRITASDIKAKWLNTLTILSGQGDDGAAIILYAPKHQAPQSLQEFTRDVIPEINRALDEAARK